MPSLSVVWTAVYPAAIIALLSVFISAHTVSAVIVNADNASRQSTVTLDSAAKDTSHSRYILSNDTSKIISLDRVIVTADKRQRLLETSQSLSVIKPAEWTGTNKTVADVIAEQTGVQTRRYGGTGSFQTVSIRGVQGSEVLVLLDGIPLNSAMGGAVDLGKINPMQLRQIEIYKGVVPGSLGGNSIGGVINLKSKKSAKGKSFDITSELGSYGKQGLTSGVSLVKDSIFSLYTTISYIKSENDFPYLDRNNTFLGPLDGSSNDPRMDDTLRRLQNNQYTSLGLNIYPSIQISKSRRLTIGSSLLKVNLHIPAPEGRINETAQYTESQIISSIALVNVDEKKFSVTPRISYTYSDCLTEWTNRDKGFGSPLGAISRYGKSGIINQTLSCDIQTRYTPTDYVEFSSLLFTRGCDANPRYDRDESTRGDWYSRQGQAGAALDIHGKIGAFRATIGSSGKIIYDATEGGLDGISNKLVPAADTINGIWATTAGLSCKPMNGMMVFLNGGRYSSEPSLRERYGAKGAIMANPMLKPETGYSSELGLKWNKDAFFLECALFYVRSINTIVFQSYGFQIQPVNVEGSRIKGIEVQSEIKLLKSLTFDLACTWQKTENLSSLHRGKQLPGQPDLTLHGGFEIRPVKQMLLAYGIEFKSFFYHDQANTDVYRVPAQINNGELKYGYPYHNCSVTWIPTKSLECKLAGNMLTSTVWPNRPAPAIEGGYSWILYPSNEWCFSTSYSF